MIRQTAIDTGAARLQPFAIASSPGPLRLGKPFDKVGRKPMITVTNAVAGGYAPGAALMIEAACADTLSELKLREGSWRAYRSRCRVDDLMG